MCQIMLFLFLGQAVTIYVIILFLNLHSLTMCLHPTLMDKNQFYQANLSRVSHVFYIVYNSTLNLKEALCNDITKYISVSIVAKLNYHILNNLHL